MARFSAANAREMAAKAHAARRDNLEAAKLAQASPPQTPQPCSENADEHLARRVAHAISLTLDKLERPDTPAKDRQALATSLRALRETFHMVTGESLPGRRKPTQDRRQARPLPAPALFSPPTAAVPENPLSA